MARKTVRKQKALQPPQLHSSCPLKIHCRKGKTSPPVKGECEESFDSPLTFVVSDFQCRVYRSLMLIPKGKVTSYKALNEFIGCKSPRAIGRALSVNPWSPQVPCHRVIKNDGGIGGFTSSKTRQQWVQKKLLLLKDEDVAFDDQGFLQNAELKFFDFEDHSANELTDDLLPKHHHKLKCFKSGCDDN